MQTANSRSRTWFYVPTSGAQ